MERLQALRYGENPSQRAALYVTEEPRGMRDLTQRQGKELSFNNLLDLDAAMWAVACWTNRPACCIIKHTTPCGIAVGRLGGRGVPQGARDRSGLGLRLGGRVQHRGGPGHRPGDERPLRRGGRRAVVPRRGAGGLRGQEAAPRGRAAGEPRRRHARLQAGARRLPGAGPVRVRRRPTRTGRSPPTASRPSASGTISGSPGPRSRRSSRTRSCSRATRWRSASAPAR